MGKYFDVIEGLKFSWARFLDLSLLKWAAVYVFFTIVISYLFGSLGAMSESMQIILALNTISILLLILFGFFILPRVYFAALRTLPMRAKMPSVIEFAILSARMIVLNALCWYDKKLLLPVVILLAASIVCLIAGMFNSMFLLASYFFFLTGVLAWAVGFTIHSLRTFFAPLMLVSGEGPESTLPKRSHEMIKGQTFELFIAILALSLIVGVATLPFFLFGAVISELPYGAALSLLLTAIIEWPYLAFRYVFFAKMYAFYAGIEIAEPSPAPSKNAKKSAPAKQIRRRKR